MVDLAPKWAKEAALLGLDMQNDTLLVFQQLRDALSPGDRGASPESLWTKRDAKIRAVEALK